MAGGSVVLDGVWQEFRELSARGTRRSKEAKWALKNVTVRVDGGECVAVLGHNGSGKTTLLKTAARIIKPTRGTCEIKGRVASIIDLNVGTNGRELTGREHIMVDGVLLGLSRSQVRARYDEIVAVSGLSSLELDQPVFTYSAGMILRICFALIVACRPDVMVTDEVMSVGDDEFRRLAFKHFEEAKASGSAILFASHDLELVGSLADRVVVLADGELVIDGPYHDSLNHYTVANPPSESPPPNLIEDRSGDRE